MPDLVLNARRVRGSVVDPLGKPIAGALVDIRRGGREVAVVRVSDAQGALRQIILFESWTTGENRRVVQLPSGAHTAEFTRAGAVLKRMEFQVPGDPELPLPELR